jgi:acetyl-CoA acetyltransferase family protein
VTYQAEIPYGAYWSTPFARWQGSLAHLHSMELAAHVAKSEIAKRKIDVKDIDYAVLGLTVLQYKSFYGLPWVTSAIGAPHVGGPTISQVCATSARCLADALQEVDTGTASFALIVTADRTSNGPQVYYPNPLGPGGSGIHENVVLDNMNDDPTIHIAMVDTAENVAREWQITTEEQHDVALRRYEQYNDALANDKAFLKRFMVLPFEVPDAKFRKTVATLDGDEGVHQTSREKMAALKPVREGGTVTYAGQTHPADGNCAMFVTTPDKAREISADPKIRVRVLGIGMARERPGYMPAAPIHAARQALQRAGLDLDDIDAIKSHNPFAVNDIVFARETGIDVMKMNNYGCSLVWGHPQGPTGMRAMIELIEELAMRGGGKGLFKGCAAGDTGMAVVLSVEDA